MEPYIKDLSYVIQNGDMENTYKMVWIRSIVETCLLNEKSEIIPFDQLSPKIFGYYWNQTIYFRLEQSPNPHKRPSIHQIVLGEIDRYQRKYGYQPIFCSRVEDKLHVPVPQISSFLSKDVCWRFPKVGGRNFDLYDLDRSKRTIRPHRPDLIKEYSDILFDLINYRWTQKLEEFNTSPRISKKVKGTDQQNIKRKSLTRFRKYLDLENPDHICFHTGDPIKDENLSIDHVIPWSYLFADDLWNLVYVDKSHNSVKGNRIPSQKTINKLVDRNRNLSRLVNIQYPKDKQNEELKLSIERDLVQKSWVGCKG